MVFKRPLGAGGQIANSSLPQLVFIGELDTQEDVTDSWDSQSAWLHWGRGVSGGKFPQLVILPHLLFIPLPPSCRFSRRPPRPRLEKLDYPKRPITMEYPGLEAHAHRRRNPLPNGLPQCRHGKTVVEFRGFRQSIVA